MSPVCPSTAPADEELARGLVAGDDDCLAATYHRWSALVQALARRSLGDAGEAEDVTQQVFLGVWRGRHGYRCERGALGAWIVGIARRRDRRRPLRADAPGRPGDLGGHRARPHRPLPPHEPRGRPRPRTDPRRTRQASRAPAAGTPPVLLRGPHPDPDRGTHRPAPGHGQEPHPAGTATVAQPPGRGIPPRLFPRLRPLHIKTK